MSESARDTQFKGFANLLMQEIDEQVGAVTQWGVEHDIDDQAKIGQELASRWQTVIARRAYDLVQHTLNHAPMTEYYADVEDIPDLTELPKEQEA